MTAGDGPCQPPALALPGLGLPRRPQDPRQASLDLGRACRGSRVQATAGQQPQEAELAGDVMSVGGSWELA